MKELKIKVEYDGEYIWAALHPTVAKPIIEGKDDKGYKNACLVCLGNLIKRLKEKGKL